MAWTVADVRRVAPELAPVADSDVSALITYADRQISPTAFANQADGLGSPTIRDIAGVWLTAHLVAMSRPELVRSFVTSKSVGSVSVSYANPLGTSPSQLRGTRFGAEYLRMVTAATGGGMVV